MTVQATGADRVLRALDTLTHPGQLDPRTLLVGAATIVLIIALERTWLGQLGPVIALAITSAWVAMAGSDGVAAARPAAARPSSRRW